MYFSAADRGEMMSMVYNWPADQVYDVCLHCNCIVYVAGPSKKELSLNLIFFNFHELVFFQNIPKIPD